MDLPSDHRLWQGKRWVGVTASMHAWERTRDWTTFEIENHPTTPAPPPAPAGPCGLTAAARWPPALIESSDTQSCFRARLGGQMDEYELDSSLAGHRHAVSATACNARSAQHDRRDWCTSMHEHACTAVSVESEHQLARHRGRCRRDPHNTRPVHLLFWEVPQKHDRMTHVTVHRLTRTCVLFAPDIPIASSSGTEVFSSLNFLSG